MSMLNNKLTLESTLAVTIFVIGLVGLMLVISTEHIYRKFALEHQEDALEDLLSLKTTDLVNELIEHQKELGYSLQSAEEFITAYRSRDTSKLVSLLDQEFNRYFVTTGKLRLEKIIIHDESLNSLAVSERGMDLGNTDIVPCNALAESVKTLAITERLKPHSQICLFDGKPLLSTLVPVDSRKLIFRSFPTRHTSWQKYSMNSVPRYRSPQLITRFCTSLTNGTPMPMEMTTFILVAYCPPQMATRL